GIIPGNRTAHRINDAEMIRCQFHSARKIATVGIKSHSASIVHRSDKVCYSVLSKYKAAVHVIACIEQYKHARLVSVRLGQRGGCDLHVGLSILAICRDSSS